MRAAASTLPEEVLSTLLNVASPDPPTKIESAVTQEHHPGWDVDREVEQTVASRGSDRAEDTEDRPRKQKPRRPSRNLEPSHGKIMTRRADFGAAENVASSTLGKAAPVRAYSGAVAERDGGTWYSARTCCPQPVELSDQQSST